MVYRKRINEPPFRHRSRRALMEHTRKHGMIFPKALAKENVFLRALLVKVF